MINETDIRRIAKHLGLKVTEFQAQYLKYDEDRDLVMNCSPCPFLLNDDKCEIYDYRPKACREYPHTGDFEFTKNIKLHAINSKYCPAVFYILEEISSRMP
jgi:Fe-S-cluster containining protein